MKKRLYIFLNYSITGVTAICYTFLLVSLLWQRQFKDFALAFLIPLACVAVCTVVRTKLNFKRPYEVDGIENLLNKKTTGKSFPSRHVCSISVIAGVVIFYMPIPGAILLALSLVLCVLRVASHVHFVRDVVAGVILGLAFASLLYLVN